MYNDASEFPFLKQTNRNNCGLTCLKMIINYYKIKGDDKKLFLFPKPETPVSFERLIYFARQLNFTCLPVKVDLQELTAHTPLPCLIHWKKKHFVIVYKINDGRISIADPAVGLLTYSADEFKLKFYEEDHSKGNCLILLPGDFTPGN